MNNEKIEPTGEKEPQNHSSLYEKTLNLREQTIKKMGEQNKTVKEILVMDAKVDPFYIGSEGDRVKAKWGYELYMEYVNKTGIDQLHNRGLHYYIVMSERKIPRPHPRCTWEYYEHTQKCSDYLNDALDKARYLGYIPFDNILDQKNRVTTITRYQETKLSYSEWVPTIDYGTYEGYISKPRIEFNYKSVDDFIDKTSRDYATIKINGSAMSDDGIKINRNVVRPFYIEAWSEKTLPKFIHQIFRELGVDVVVEGGELSLKIMYDFVQRLNKNKQDGVALYFSDYDYKGNDMPLNMSQKIQWAKCVEMLEQKAYLQPVALTEEQIIKYNLPLATLKETGETKKKGHDTLIKKFKGKQKIEGFAELQALEGNPEIYKEIVRTAIKKWIIPKFEIEKAIENEKSRLKELIQRSVKKEMEKQRKYFKTQYDIVKRIQSRVRKAVPMQSEIIRFEKKYEDARKIISENNKGEIESKLDDIYNKIELPEIIEPHTRREPTIECLYDSRRDNEDQFKILYNRKVTKEIK